MSLEAAVARMHELQRMLQPPPVAAPPPPPAADTAFSAALASASAPAAAGAPAATAAGAVPAPAASGELRGVPFGNEITAAARRHGVDPALLAGLVRQESNFDPGAVSPAGARGLTQLMPATAAGLGVTDPSDPQQALDGGAKYLRQQLDRFGGDVAKALAAYNAGPGAVERHGGVPPYAETRAYVQKVQAFADGYRANAGPPASAAAASLAGPPAAAGVPGATPTQLPSRPPAAALPYSTL
jgi:soluble lytic murein transglycosylase-like protein